MDRVLVQPACLAYRPSTLFPSLVNAAKRHGSLSLSSGSMRNRSISLNASGRSWEPADDFLPPGFLWDTTNMTSQENASLVPIKDGEAFDTLATPFQMLGDNCKALVPVKQTGMNNSTTSLQILSKDRAMGLALRAVAGTGWTTGSGLEGPSSSFLIKESEDGKTRRAERGLPIINKSPRRSMGVAFTCNVCGERTIRAINPHAYTDGTVFVQCGGCNVFHKLVDNLNLFHELTGRVFPGNGVSGMAEHEPYDFLGLDQFPLL